MLMMKEIKETIQLIAKELIDCSVLPNIGLLSGEMGKVLFLYEYSKYNKKYHKYAEEKIDQIYQSIYDGNIYHSYCAGLAGICLAIYYLQDRNFLTKCTVPISTDIDDYLAQQMERCIIQNQYDFLHGAVGIGFYFLEQYKIGNRMAATKLNKIFKYLEDSAIIESGLIKWLSYSANLQKKVYDLSLSHGISSIIIFLCRLLTLPNINQHIHPEKIKRLIYGAAQYILSQEIDVIKYNSYFPYTSKESENIKGSRLAWCYGDLGIAIALLECACTLNMPSMHQKTIEILRFSCNRRNPLENFVMDAGLCHGSAGIALIFYHLFYKFNNNIYLNTSQYWIEKTIEFCNPQNGINSFKTFYDMKNNTWIKSTNFLEGLAGIGLLLLSFYYKEKPYWSKFLLLS